MLIHAVEGLAPGKCGNQEKIQVFLIFRSQKLLRARYWEGKLKKTGIMGKKGNMKIK